MTKVQGIPIQKRTVVPGKNGCFVVIEMSLLGDGQIVVELTAVDTEKGKNVSMGLTHEMLGHLLYLRRYLRGLDTRHRYRAALKTRKEQAGEMKREEA